MNIIFDNIIFSLQKSGGISVVWYELLRRMSLANCQFLEYDNAYDNIFRKELNIPLHNLSLKQSKYLSYNRYINPKALRDSEGIPFHSSYYRTMKGCRNITTVHDFTYEYFVKGLKKKVHTWQKRRAILNSERVICVSQNTKNDLIRFCPEYNRDNIKVIYNGVSEDYCQLSHIEPIQGIDYNSGEYLLYVGDRLAPYKQFPVAVEVARITHRPLVIVGKPLLCNEKKLLLGIEHVCLSGLTTTELNRVYNSAFCFIYPSLYEGFGIPVIEAQKAGCPVIAGNNSSITEIAVDSAYLLDDVTPINIAKAIRDLENVSRSQDLINRGLENSLRFSWNKTFEETINVYKELGFKE